MKIQSKRIVIDTSIAKSAGGKKSIDFQSTGCRNFLQEVLSICHKAVFNKELKDEWDRHQSRFARKWLSIMKKRGKLIEIKRAKYQKLRDKIEEYAPHQSAFKAMMKDIFLVEVAIKTDNVIATRDSTVKEYFMNISNQIGELKDIIWLNPCDENVIEWLKSVAMSEKSLKLQ